MSEFTLKFRNEIETLVKCDKCGNEIKIVVKKEEEK